MDPLLNLKNIDNLKVILGFSLPFCPTVRNFSSQYLQAHNDLKASTDQRGAADALEGRAALQRDLGRLRGAAKRLR